MSARGTPALGPPASETVSTRGLRVHRAAWAAGVALAASVPGPALGHQLEHPSMLRVGLQPGALVVSVTYDVDAGEPSRLLRNLFDRDASGTLEAGEQDKLLRYLEDTARLFLRVELGGEPVALARRAREGHHLDLPVAATSGLGVALVLTASVADPSAWSRVRIQDRDKDGAKRVPVVVDIGPGLRLRYASRGEWHPAMRAIHRVMLGPSRDLDLVLAVEPKRTPT